MEQESFYINNRFFTDPATNVVKEISGESETHLEPRLMLLLCLLSKNVGKVVSREYLIKEIWNDYGGADEGLTQAISFLRRIIGDKNKKIIETVPKKGYILHATITRNFNEKTIEIIKKKSHLHVFGIFLMLIIILISGYLLLNKPAIKSISKSVNEISSSDRKVNNTDSIKNKDIQVNFPDLKKGDDENYLNTISTKDSKGVTYRLVLIGDRRPVFYVNGKLITGDIPDKFAILIDRLSKELWARQNKARDSIK